MKIIFVLHQFSATNTGGTELVVGQLAAALRARGHDMVIVAGSLERAACTRVDHEIVAGLPVLRLHRDDLHFENWWKAWSPGVSATFARLLAEHRPDVVHVHHWLRTTTDFARLAREAGAVAAITFHDHFAVLAGAVRAFGQDRPEPPAASGLIGALEAREAFAFHRDDLADEIAAAHLLYAPSRAHAESIRRLAVVDPGKIMASPPPQHSRGFPRRPGAARGRRLAAFGSLYEAKGSHVLLDALRLAASRGYTWELELFGSAASPEYEARLDVASRGLPVRRHGAFSIEQVAAVAADYAVFPALTHESYGLVIDEAQALGLPMLLSDLPAYREHAPVGSCVFFSPGNAEQLAALLCAPELLGELPPPVPPTVVEPDALVTGLLADYSRARTEHVAPRPPIVTQARRVAMLWARSERRFWSALQVPHPPAPTE